MINLPKNIFTGHSAVSQVFNIPEVKIIAFNNTKKDQIKISDFSKKYLYTTEFINEPMPGFSLLKVDRKDWTHNENRWIVIDPRGFMTEITSSNLDGILETSSITQGLIQQPCVWARYDQQTKLILIPVNSKKYEDAVKNTILIEHRVNIKDVNIGDTVLLRDNIEGVYMGNLSMYGVYRRTGLTNPIYMAETLLRKQIICIAPDVFYYKTNADILKVINRSKQIMSRSDSAEIINDSIESGRVVFTEFPILTRNYPSLRHLIRHVSTHSTTVVPYSLEEVDYSTASELFYQGVDRSDPSILMFETNTGKRFLANHKHHWLTPSTKINTLNNFSSVEVDMSFNTSDQIIIKDINAPRVRSSIDNFTTFYKIIKHVKNETYI